MSPIQVISCSGNKLAALFWIVTESPTGGSRVESLKFIRFNTLLNVLTWHIN